jgi:hypothetical protein
MRKSLLVLIAWVLAAESGIAQVPDASVTIHQNTLNGFLAAVGPLSGTGQFNLIGIKGDYVWSLRNARIELTPDHAQFLADGNVKTGTFSYSSPAVGDVEIKYHPETNRISVKVLKTAFEVYTKILGKKIHITDIDAARFYRLEFEFAGPQPVQPKVDIVLPDKTVKTIYITPASQDLHLERERIVVTSQLVFSDRPVKTRSEENRSRDRH